MKIQFARFLTAAMLLVAFPLAAAAAEAPAYPGETIDGSWLSINGTRTFDAKAGKSTTLSMEGNKEEAALKIISDDGETVVFTEDGLNYTAKKSPDGSVELVMKGREKFPVKLTKDK